ncbi:hypothetical protein MKW94_002821 [Papaver nudicaule]|uniref:DC1 domain-containing protein n=1 Tax=Papaver nudicaule TaxID=74823 RepID=A0AA41UXB2_PAPNU|nr:hypothetical protein [Papaver nudicaule]
MALPTRKHSHPHILIKEAFDQNLGVGYEKGDFVCDACNTLGSGVRYHCRQCNFDLHEECATCPDKFKPRMGEIRIYQRIPSCNVCGDQVDVLFYECLYGERCCFFVHPLCTTKLPLEVRHVIDTIHPLTFQSAPFIPNSPCAICRSLVSASSWSYRCDPCGINIHLECVTLPYFEASSSSRSPRDPHQQMHRERRPVPPPPPLSSPPYDDDGNGGTAPPAHSCIYPHYYNYPPSSHYYSYPPASTLQRYHNYYTPCCSSHQEPTSSSTEPS